MQSIPTERLLLRPFTLNDLEDLYAYAKSPNVGPSAGWKPHEDLEDSLYILKRFVETDLNWAIVELESSRVIGSVSLNTDKTRNIEGVRKLGYSMGEDYWGRGYMTEAARAVVAYGFCSLGLCIISVDHYPENSRSKRVVEKCGFTYEGTLRMAIALFDGSLHDLCCYSITRDEFELQNG